MTEDLAKWQAAVAKHKRQQRTGRPQRKPPAIRPGMLRRSPDDGGDGDGEGDHPDHPDGPPPAA